MSTSKPVSVLFTGYAHVHFLCFRPLYERLLHLPGVEVWVSGGLRTTADQGYLYDAAAMYTPFGIPPQRILPVEALQRRRFDVLFSANKRLIPPSEQIPTRVMIFQGLSFRNRGGRPENLTYTDFLVIGPYMRRKFSEAGLMAADDPRLISIGFPKTDPLCTGSLDRQALLRRYGFDGTRPVLLYAPTGQEHNSLETMGQEVIHRLTASGTYDLLIKPHDPRPIRLSTALKPWRLWKGRIPEWCASWTSFPCCFWPMYSSQTPRPWPTSMPCWTGRSFTWMYQSSSRPHGTSGRSLTWRPGGGVVGW